MLSLPRYGKINIPQMEQGISLSQPDMSWNTGPGPG